MEPIVIVIQIYMRENYLQRQLESLCKQTVVNQLDIHVVSNNPKINFKKIADKFNDRLKITFIQRNNEHTHFERHLYIEQQNFEYVIILDDDIFPGPHQVETLWKLRQPRTYKTFFGRIFTEQDRRTKKWKESTSYARSPLDLEFNYGGTAFSIIDASIFTPFIKTYKKIREEHNPFFDNNVTEDHFLSWVIDGTPGWKIINSKQNIDTSYGDDVHASYNYKKNKKNNFITFLHELRPWKMIKK